MDTKNAFSYIKDTSFDSKRIGDPYILEAYIPDEYYHHIDNPPLSKRNALIHPVGLVAARSLKYLSVNGEAFNIFRTREMAVWWLRHIYNSFNWWNAYVVNAEGERKDWPMLYIGENVGSAIGNKAREYDIVLSAFENDRCIVNHEAKGGTIFAAGYSNRGGLFNSPDMYGVKIIVANKYKGAGVRVTRGITKNLHLMAEHLLRNLHKEITVSNIHDVIKKMKVVVLDRLRHNKLVEKIESIGAEVILTRDDDLTPTLLVASNEVDLIVGVGGVPEAVLSALIVENLGGEMTMRLLPAEIVKDERLLLKFKNWESFRKEEIDILKNFQIVRPGSEKEGEIPWDKEWTSSDLARGDDMVFTASIIKKTPWIKDGDGEETPGVEIERETGDITVHIVRVTKNKFEIIPVIYKTNIGKLNEEYRRETSRIKRGNILIRLIKAYTEFGLFKEAKECLQKVNESNFDNKDLLHRNEAISKYVTGLDILKNKSDLSPEDVIKPFRDACCSDRLDKERLRTGRMIKRFYEYLGDKNYHNVRYYKAMVYYRKALQYSPHELKIYDKLISIEMMDMQKVYFNKIDSLYKELDFNDADDWNSIKLGIALDVFYDNLKKQKNFSCANPWFIFFRKTVLHSKRPSYQMAVSLKLLKLQNKLNHAQDAELTIFLNKEFEISTKETDIILNARKEKDKLRSVSDLYLVKGLDMICLTRLLFPHVKVSVHNELEDLHIPLSITIVKAMERRTDNILEELREGYREDAQEHQYSLAESYHYAGLVFYDMGDIKAVKIYYDKAIAHLTAIIQRFEGITPVNAQFRIGDLYYELGLLFPENQVTLHGKSIEAYMCIVDKEKFIRLFGNIMDLATTIRQEAFNMVIWIRRELNYKHF